MSRAARTIVVTGATGMLGRACCRYFTARGWVVRAVVRRPAAARHLEPWAQGGIYPGELPGGVDRRAFEGQPAAVVHCAYATAARDQRRADRVNVEGTRVVRALAAEQGAARFVFLSSMAAVPDAESRYARSKLQIERTLDPALISCCAPAWWWGGAGSSAACARRSAPHRWCPCSTVGGRRFTLSGSGICAGRSNRASSGT
ncbi:MAG: NAD-dependent epimerase/dehydratase family protein [Acidimicrobiia bacterium]|nr:NAD-dependent epimerase/dehydratase family protein [Acidimicrobiia bacterium]